MPAGVESSVALVFGDAALLILLFRQMLETRQVLCTGPLACVSPSFQSAVDEAARFLVKQLWPLAHRVAGESWGVHWFLLAGVSSDGRWLSIVCDALYNGDSPTFKPKEIAKVRKSKSKLQEIEEALGLLVMTSAPVLGSRGPTSILPMQTALFQRLGLQGGALSGAVDKILQLNMAKAEVLGGADRIATLLDRAELLNLRAYMRTYVSRKRSSCEELDNALQATELAAGALLDDMGLQPDAFFVRGPQASQLIESIRRKYACANRFYMLYARTLTSAAHALAVGAVPFSSFRKKLLQRGEPEVMFQKAVKLYEDVIEFHTSCSSLYISVSEASMVNFARQIDSSTALEQAKLMASFGECWFCIASAIDVLGHALLDCDYRAASMRCRKILQASLSLFRYHDLTDCVEIADALKDYGKAMNCHFGGVGDGFLRESVDLHRRLLGKEHPRTVNALRLLSEHSDSE